MSDEKLAPFRAGDRQRRRVSGAPRPQDDGEGAGASAGFTRIEGILDAANPSEVGARLDALLAALAEREQAATQTRDRAACRRARAAVERTMDLLTHLFRTKVALESAAHADAGSSK